MYRDVDETISWIKEKEQLMASDDFGRDLASVQALLRKHEGLERDLAALEDKVSISTSAYFIQYNYYFGNLSQKNLQYRFDLARLSNCISLYRMLIQRVNFTNILKSS